ncbi:hypothetical protein [Galactobacter caseinivorans]|nr:hypothetical protein [Galactobacter caseinivorans]
MAGGADQNDERALKHHAAPVRIGNGLLSNVSSQVIRRVAVGVLTKCQVN